MVLAGAGVPDCAQRTTLPYTFFFQVPAQPKYVAAGLRRGFAPGDTMGHGVALALVIFALRAASSLVSARCPYAASGGIGALGAAPARFSGRRLQQDPNSPVVMAPQSQARPMTWSRAMRPRIGTG